MCRYVCFWLYLRSSVGLQLISIFNTTFFHELSLLSNSVIDLRMRYLQTAQEWVEDLYDYYIGNKIPHYL